MDFLNRLAIDGLRRFDVTSRDLRIDNILIGKSLYSMKSSSRVFTDMNFCLILLERGYGFSYFQSPIDWSMQRYIGRRADSLLENEIPLYLRTALVDAIYCLGNGVPVPPERILKGSLREKAAERARVIFSVVPSRSKILLLGAATELVEQGIVSTCDLRILDLEEQKVAMEICGIAVERAEPALFEEALDWSDFVIATGMIFPCGWAVKLFESVQERDRKLVLYMESGANFGGALLSHGAYAVFAEFFPFYDFYGDTRYVLHVPSLP